jgi:hypothetical protein
MQRGTHREGEKIVQKYGLENLTGKDQDLAVDGSITGRLMNALGNLYVP